METLFILYVERKKEGSGRLLIRKLKLTVKTFLSDLSSTAIRWATDSQITAEKARTVDDGKVQLSGTNSTK